MLLFLPPTQILAWNLLFCVSNSEYWLDRKAERGRWEGSLEGVGLAECRQKVERGRAGEGETFKQGGHMKFIIKTQHDEKIIQNTTICSQIKKYIIYFFKKRSSRVLPCMPQSFFQKPGLLKKNLLLCQRLDVGQGGSQALPSPCKKYRPSLFTLVAHQNQIVKPT